MRYFHGARNSGTAGMVKPMEIRTEEVLPEEDSGDCVFHGSSSTTQYFRNEGAFRCESIAANIRSTSYLLVDVM